MVSGFKESLWGIFVSKWCKLKYRLLYLEQFCNWPVWAKFPIFIQQQLNSWNETEVHPYIYPIFIYLNLFLIDGKLLCNVVLASVVQQHELAKIHTHPFPLELPFPTPACPSGLSRSSRLSLLCSIAASHCYPFHVVACMFQCYFLNLSHLVSIPLCPQPVSLCQGWSASSWDTLTSHHIIHCIRGWKQLRRRNELLLYPIWCLHINKLVGISVLEINAPCGITHFNNHFRYLTFLT